jgi:uncharacterized MAPEG superfamily protein
MQHDLLWLVGISIFTGLEWIPYILERIYRVGLLNAMGYDTEIINANVAKWACRCQKAHINAIENLVIFIPLVIVSHISQINILVAIKVFCLARITHYICYTFSVPFLRTLAFFAGVGAELYIAYQLLIMC